MYTQMEKHKVFKNMKEK